MWGAVVSASDLYTKPGGEQIRGMIHNEKHDVIVDRPARTKGIFEGCVWKEFISSR